MKLKTALVATALTMSASGLANAQFASQAEMMMGPYISLGGGVNWVQGSGLTIEGFGGPDIDIGDIRFKTGWTANGAIGYAFGFGPRIEVEVSYRRNHTRDEVKFGVCDGAPKLYASCAVIAWLLGSKAPSVNGGVQQVKPAIPLRSSVCKNV